MFRGLIIAVCAAVLFASGCASVPMGPATQDAALKTFPAPEEGSAGVYIYRNSFVGQALKKNLYLDGEFLGESANKTYFYKQVKPGEHTVSTESEFSDNAFKFVALEGVNHFIKYMGNATYTDFLCSLGLHVKEIVTFFTYRK